jgi:hypothetical protein
MKIPALALLLFIVILTMMSTAAYSQHQLLLIKRNSQRRFVINENDRVVFVLRGNLRGRIGLLNHIDEQALTIDNTTIPISDFSAIGHRRKGQGFFRFVCSFFAGSLIGAAISNGNDSGIPACNGCQTTTTGTNPVPFYLGVAAVLIVLDVNTYSTDTFSVSGPGKLCTLLNSQSTAFIANSSPSSHFRTLQNRKM